MKNLLFILAMLVALVGSAQKPVKVKGYVKKDGTYVAPYYRSSPNKTKADNWSSKGNTNLYTGKRGKKKY